MFGTFLEHVPGLGVRNVPVTLAAQNDGQPAEEARLAVEVLVARGWNGTL